MREEERERGGNAERGREKEEGERERKINNVLFTHDFANKN